MSGVPQVAGDYNQNGVVDAADYVAWRNSIGQNVPLPNRGPGITGPIGQSDYNFWRSRFGATSGAGSGASVASVPEPVTLAALASCLAGCGVWWAGARRRQGKSCRGIRIPLR
jgi:hypothetical protein